MSCAQAFHTSCRHGLSGHAGFQYNAASGGLDETQLARIAAEHAGYRAPPDAPPEPSEEEMAQLPVALRYLPVEGVGPVVSRTAYVGREFRGAGEEPDSGRFGNYFSHIVVGDGEDGGFHGLLPIELWGAPHWSTSEVRNTELPPLDTIEPGPIDLDRVLGQLLPNRAETLAAVSDAALQAVLGGPRLVVVEAEPDLGAAWVAWACFALPPDRMTELTFSTFDGRPRGTEGVRLCVTSPACDVDFPSYELGSAVVVLDPGSPPDPRDLSLYGRVLDALVRDGAEAVAVATRDLSPGLDLAGVGAELAIAARRTDLAAAADLPGVLAALRGRLGTTPVAALAEMAAAVPSGEASKEELGEWGRLHAAARESADPEATALADETLGRLLDSLEEAPPDLPEVDPDSPAVPSAAVLARWLDMVAGATGTQWLGPLLAAGVRLGLVGCNTALDRELAEPIAAGFADPVVQAAYERIVAAGNARVIEAVALKLAAAAGAGRGLDLLRRAAVEPIARDAVRAHAEEAGDFEAVAAWQLLCADSNPSQRASAATALAARAESDGHERAVRGLYGKVGPSRPAEHAELLAAWAVAGRQAPILDCQRGLECLAELPLGEADRAERLFGVLWDASAAVRRDPVCIAWSLSLERAPRQRPFRDWAETAARLAGAGEASLSPARETEMRALAARVAIDSREEDDFVQGVELLLRSMGEGWPLDLGDALAGEVDHSVDPERLIARVFISWHRAKRCREDLIELALPRATRDLPARQLEAVGAKIPERGRDIWEWWLERHPPRRAVSRAVRNVLRRGEGR